MISLLTDKDVYFVLECKCLKTILSKIIFLVLLQKVLAGPPDSKTSVPRAPFM